MVIKLEQATRINKMAAVKQPVQIQQSVEEFSKKWGNSEEDFKEDLKAFVMNVISNNVKTSSKETNVLSDKLDEIMKKLNDIQEENREIKEKLKSAPGKTTTTTTTTTKKSVLGKFASAAAKKLADDNDIKEEDIEGTGKNDKILMKDIKKHIEPAKETKKKKVKGKKDTDKHPCGGISKTGNACKMSGKTKADDGVWYCNRHIVDYQEQQDIIEEEDDIESIADGDIEFKISAEDDDDDLGEEDDFNKENDSDEDDEGKEIIESDNELESDEELESEEEE